VSRVIVHQLRTPRLLSGKEVEGNMKLSKVKIQKYSTKKEAERVARKLADTTNKTLVQAGKYVVTWKD
jgi:RNA-binding protein YhbY